MNLKSTMKKLGWKLAAAAASLLVLLVMILAIVIPKKHSAAIMSAAFEAQQKLGDNAKEHEVRIAVAKTKHDEGENHLQDELARIDAMPSSHDRRAALIEMHKRL